MYQVDNNAEKIHMVQWENDVENAFAKIDKKNESLFTKI